MENKRIEASQEGDIISRQTAIDAFMKATSDGDKFDWCKWVLKQVPSEQPEPKWIPCSERKPKINQIILLSTNMGNVYVGRRGKPDIIWQVTESDGSKLWVYDPEAYTDDIDSLPKSEDYSFYGVDGYMSWESVSSVNYDDKYEGIIAWMPLPEPYKGESDE